jgi:hypothetical protein
MVRKSKSFTDCILPCCLWLLLLEHRVLCYLTEPQNASIEEGVQKASQKSFFKDGAHMSQAGGEDCSLVKQSPA